MMLTSTFGSVVDLPPFYLHIDISKKEVTLKAGERKRVQRFTNKKDCWRCFWKTRKMIGQLYMFGEDI